MQTSTEELLTIQVNLDIRPDLIDITNITQFKIPEYSIKLKYQNSSEIKENEAKINVNSGKEIIQTKLTKQAYQNFNKALFELNQTYERNKKLQNERRNRADFVEKFENLSTEEKYQKLRKWEKLEKNNLQLKIVRINTYPRTADTELVKSNMSGTYTKKKCGFFKHSSVLYLHVYPEPPEINHPFYDKIMEYTKKYKTDGYVKVLELKSSGSNTFSTGKALRKDKECHNPKYVKVIKIMDELIKILDPPIEFR